MCKAKKLTLHVRSGVFHCHSMESIQLALLSQYACRHVDLLT